MRKKTGIELALERFEGSPTRMAEAVGGGVIRQHIEHWLKTGVVPAAKAPDVEAATGIKAELLCPSVNWAVIRGNQKAVA